MCFRNAARHLAPGGRFVVELWVPELRKLAPGRRAVVWHSESGYIGLDIPRAAATEVSHQSDLVKIGRLSYSALLTAMLA